jgi:endonuclease/exonuclease/phosphatase family metal-dependent hydrolase
LSSEEPRVSVLIAGDLNENWDEYARVGGLYQTALLPDSQAFASAETRRSLFVTGVPKRARVDAGRVVFYSPWSELEGAGSYHYRRKWETIDQILVGPRLVDGKSLEYDSFSVVRPDFLLTSKGFPFGWSSDRGSGYSDHLPILLTLSTGS